MACSGSLRIGVYLNMSAYLFWCIWVDDTDFFERGPIRVSFLGSRRSLHWGHLRQLMQLRDESRYGVPGGTPKVPNPPSD